MEQNKKCEKIYYSRNPITNNITNMPCNGIKIYNAEGYNICNECYSVSDIIILPEYIRNR